MPVKSSSSGGKPLSVEDRKQRIGMTALMLALIALGCVPLYFGVQGAREAWKSSGWPTAPGRIIKSEMRVETSKISSGRNHGGMGRRKGGIQESYHVDLEYEFVADGVTYRGTRISVVNEELGNKETTQSLLEKYPVGREVTVSHKPGEPGQSVLEPGHLGGAVFFLFLGSGLILMPLLFLPAIWSSNSSRTGPHDATEEQRQRFDLIFRERFLEWEPGQRIHLHRDPTGLLTVVGRALAFGFIIGAFLGIPTGFWLFSGRDLILIAEFYAGVSLVLAVMTGISIGLDGRRRDTVMDWSRETIRLQVGWKTREFTFDELQELTLQVSEPRQPTTPQTTKSSKPTRSRSRKTHNANGPQTTYPARIVLLATGKRYVLLEVACLPAAIPETRSRLQIVAQELAASLKISMA